VKETTLSEEQLNKIADLALAEDAGYGDITSAALIPPGLSGRASVLIKEKGILAGGEVASRVFLRTDPSLTVQLLVEDGKEVESGEKVAAVSGRVISILRAERTALNFLQRLSGIASMTAQYVARVSGCRAVITDTRKTTPGLRMLEKYAVRMGGGRNHRFHLGDGILIKDNHLAVLYHSGMNLSGIVARAKQNAPAGIKVEVEVTTIQEALDAVAAGANIIMLDNMSPEEMGKAVGAVNGQVEIEASGGITLDNVRQVAMTGVDIISIGALTHSVRALDISLEIEPETLKLL